MGISEVEIEGSLAQNQLDTLSTMQRVEVEVQSLLDAIQSYVLDIFDIKKTLANLSSSSGEIP